MINIIKTQNTKKTQAFLVVAFRKKYLLIILPFIQAHIGTKLGIQYRKSFDTVKALKH
jgi:hypothetical protein